MIDGGKFVLTPESAARLVAAFDANENDVMIDYEHALVRKATQGQPAPAAGWIKSMKYAEGRGLVASIDWTAEARDRIRKKEYRYSSPVVKVKSESGEITEFINLAITNAPLTVGAPELIAASRSLQVARENPTMPKDDNPVVTLAAIAKRLGLPESAEETLILSKIDELGGHVGYVSADDYKKLSDRVGELQAADLDRRVEDAVSKIVAANKLNPNDADRMKWARDFAKRDLAGFEVVAAGLPVIIDPTRIVGSPGKPAGGEGDRKTIIASSVKQCRESGWSTYLSGGVPSWVNDELRMKGLPLLTEDETKNLATIGG